MSLKTYRCYRLDDAGHLHQPEWFEAASDEDAIAQISEKHSDSTGEIWWGKRLVASVAANRLQA